MFQQSPFRITLEYIIDQHQQPLPLCLLAPQLQEAVRTQYSDAIQTIELTFRPVTYDDYARVLRQHQREASAMGGTPILGAMLQSLVAITLESWSLDRPANADEFGKLHPLLVNGICALWSEYTHVTTATLLALIAGSPTQLASEIQIDSFFLSSDAQNAVLSEMQQQVAAAQAPSAQPSAPNDNVSQDAASAPAPQSSPQVPTPPPPPTMPAPPATSNEAASS